MKVSSLAAPKVVILTTFGAASDEDFIKMKTFSFQWNSYFHLSPAFMGQLYTAKSRI